MSSLRPVKCDSDVMFVFSRVLISCFVNYMSIKCGVVLVLPLMTFSSAVEPYHVMTYPEFPPLTTWLEMRSKAYLSIDFHTFLSSFCAVTNHVELGFIHQLAILPRTVLRAAHLDIWIGVNRLRS